MAVAQEVLDTIALSRDEYALIVQRLGREPNEVELGMFGALWSEHCGYKNSKPLLRLLPAEGPYVLTRRGAENAGAVDVGDGICVVLKIESHNHPSAIEPYQGAATGVGGIVRDIFAMGARPIAILDSLRFGPIAPSSPAGDFPNPTSPDPKVDPTADAVVRNRYLFGGVVAGIAGYGNCLGIPTVGGEVAFEDSYSANPLVNAMCVGIAPVGRLASAKAEGPGNILMLVGADTGRDGIHGASGLASRTDPQSRFEELRPAVQVGNPFLEKMLMEACLDLAHHHADWITGIQDLGAAGLSASSAESAARAGTGLVIDVAKVPRREESMTPYEVMLSESQERMLIIVREGHEDDVAGLFERWEVPWTIIGHVSDDRLIHIMDGDGEVATLPVGILVEAPEYTREGVRPQELGEMEALDLLALPDLDVAMGVRAGLPSSTASPDVSYRTSDGPTSLRDEPKPAPTGAGSAVDVESKPALTDGSPTPNAALLRLLASPNIASKRWVYRQYDQSVLSNTVVTAGADAAVMRIKGTQKGIAVAVDGNGRYAHLSPYAGGAMAVAEAARNVVCVGAQPVAVTDCLNFGNPERPEVYYQMQEVIRGISDACSELGTPVISGNVSLYNETGDRGVYPTPVIGMLGILDDVTRYCRMAFANDADEVFVLGAMLEQSAASLAGSEYLKGMHSVVGGRLSMDLGLEARLHRAVLALIRQRIATAAHDCSDGGLAVALVEMSLAGSKGLDAAGADLGLRLDAALFGEAQSRVIITTRPGERGAIDQIARAGDIPFARIGRVTAERRLRLGPIDLSLDEMRDANEGGLERALTDKPV